MYVRVVPLDASVAYVESARCVECHAATMSQPARGSSGLKISHKDCAVGRSCTDCHSTVAHGSALPWPRTPTMELCFECHGANGAPAGCDECHVERIPSDRIQTSSFSVTHGSNARKTHGLGAMSSCDPCHGSTKCQPCHGAGVPHGKNFASKHSDSAVAEGARCTGCHVVSFCNGCHRLEMPHPPSFVKEHPAAAARDERICKRCHDPRDCTECHERHIHPVTIEQLRRLGLDIPKDGTE